MLQAAARRNGAGGIDGGTALLDRHDFALGVDNERSTVCQIGWAEHAIELHHIALVVREHREFSVELFGPMVEGCYEIATDCQHLCVGVLEFANTRLVGGEFARST